MARAWVTYICCCEDDGQTKVATRGLAAVEHDRHCTELKH